MGERRRILVLLFLLWLASDCAGAVEPGRFVISQVAVKPPEVTVYLDAVDENGEALVRLPPSALTATIQGQPVNVSQVATFDSSGEGVAYIFLVDVSRSLGSAQFAQIMQAIDEWIDGLKSADRMAIFTFGAQYKQLAGFTADKARLKSALQNLKPVDSQTKLYLALNNAINLSRQTVAGLPNRRVIVVLSDGKDEGSGITVEDVRELIQQSHVPIYAIGYSRLPVRDREHYLQVLNRLATLSGGNYTEAASVKTAYEETESTIRRLFVVRLNCQRCAADTQPHPLEMTLRSGTVARTSTLAVNLIVPPPQTITDPQVKSGWDQAWEWAIKWKSVLAVVLVVGVGFTVGVQFDLGKRVFRLFKEGETIIEHTEVKLQNDIRQIVSPPSPHGRAIELTVVAGKEHGYSQNLKLIEKLVIGRDHGCDASFPDDTEMSGRHFELLAVGPHVEVNDLGSTNGTLLNGAQLVVSHRLVDGDLVRAGRTELRINIGGVT